VTAVRRTIVIAGALAAALVIPVIPVITVIPASAGGAGSAVRTGPDVPDANLRASVRSLNTSVRSLNIGAAVRDIDLSRSVTALEEEKSEGGVVTVRISSDVLFEFNEATLTAAARQEIGRIATRLRGVTGVVRVSGHSDSIGQPAYNLRLSRARANAVAAELRRLLGGAGRAGGAGGVRITAAGYGETRPVAPNMSDGEDDPAGRAKNRRVEITFRTS
jgi:outer membrane protein OmpA-like peptidoglycan-associated protein